MFRLAESLNSFVIKVDPNDLTLLFLLFPGITMIMLAALLFTLPLLLLYENGNISNTVVNFNFTTNNVSTVQSRGVRTFDSQLGGHEFESRSLHLKPET